MKVIINVNIEIDAKKAKTIEEAYEIADNYELPHGYQEDTYEIVKVLDDNGNELIDDNLKQWV